MTGFGHPATIWHRRRSGYRTAFDVGSEDERSFMSTRIAVGGSSKRASHRPSPAFQLSDPRSATDCHARKDDMQPDLERSHRSKQQRSRRLFSRFLAAMMP